MLKPDLRRRPLLVLALVLLAIASVKPVGQWIERSSIIAFFGPNACAAHVSLVKQSNSVQISDLKWSESLSSTRRLEVAVAQMWAKYLPDQLLLKRFHSPKLILDGVSLHLHTDEPLREAKDTTPTVAQQWRAEIDQQLYQMQPERIVTQSKSVGRSKVLLASWISQFTSWADQGSQILLESQEVKKQLDGFSDNPLRHEREIISGLSQLQTLYQNLERVELEVKESERILETHRRMLSNLKQEDLNEFASVYALRPQPFSQEIGKRVICDWFKAAWRDQAGQSESIGALISDWMCRPIPSARGWDLRSTDLRNSAVSIADATARGVIVVDDHSIPFSANGNYVRGTGSLPSSKATWRFSIITPTLDSVIVTKVDPEDERTGCRMVVASYPKPASTTATVKERTSSASVPMIQFDYTSHGQRLNGTGSLDVTRWLLNSPADNEDALIAIDDIPTDLQESPEPLLARFRIQGSWVKPNVTLLDEVPRWVADKLETQFNSELFATKQTADELLEQRLQTAIEQLNRTVAGSRSSCLTRSKQLRQQLLSLRNGIHRELELRSDTNFVQRIIVKPFSR